LQMEIGAQKKEMKEIQIRLSRKLTSTETNLLLLPPEKGGILSNLDKAQQKQRQISFQIPAAVCYLPISAPDTPT